MTAVPGAGRTVPLADTQLSILGFVSGAGAGQDPYVLSCCFEVDGPIDVDAFARASQGLALRHESLRTRFTDDAGEWRQAVAEPSAVDFDYRQVEGPDPRGTALALVEEECRRGFDVTRTTLFRVRLYGIGRDRYLALFLFHHLTFDGWSRTTAIRDFGSFYTRRWTDGGPPVRQYRDFIERQLAHTRGEDFDRHVAYWKRRLQDFQPNGLVADAAGQGDDYTAGKYTLTLPDGLQQELAEASRLLGMSPYLVHTAAWSLAIGDIFGAQSFLLASPVALRYRSGWADIVGDLTNMLLLPVSVEPGTPVRAVLGDLQAEHHRALDHLDIHYQRTMRAIDRPTTYHVRIGYHSQAPVKLDLPGTRCRELSPPGDPATRRLVSLELDASGSTPVGTVLYRRSLVPQADALGLRTAYIARLKEAAELMRRPGRA